jgi:Flp pilus assembly protein TadG
MPRKSSLFGSESGAVLVEFALVSIVLILLLVGIFEFGMVYNFQLSMDNAAREGVRFAVVPNSTATTDSQIKNYIITNWPMRTNPNFALAATNIAIAPATRVRSQPVTVTISFRYPIPITLGVLPAEINLTAAATMRN